MKYFAPFGWILPLVITVTWVLANHFFRNKDAKCWDSNLSKYKKITLKYHVKDLVLIEPPSIGTWGLTCRRARRIVTFPTVFPEAN